MAQNWPVVNLSPPKSICYTVQLPLRRPSSRASPQQRHKKLGSWTSNLTHSREKRITQLIILLAVALSFPVFHALKQDREVYKKKTKVN